ncbi:MAG: threonylcarbamoyl-AMP synthase, partial [Betaproteobacteria bacterium]|nr:threonylcarbamoyl-AMP synthase [Betaproteobacteria bacterium]
MRRLMIHPDNPQPRLIQQAAQALRDGDLLIMPTDACAVIAASMAHKNAVDRLRAIRQLNERHLLTLL